MREQFEQLPEIKRRLHHLVFNEKLNIYECRGFDEFRYVNWVNGAWWAWQQLQGATMVCDQRIEGNWKP